MGAYRIRLKTRTNKYWWNGIGWGGKPGAKSYINLYPALRRAKKQADGLYENESVCVVYGPTLPQD